MQTFIFTVLFLFLLATSGSYLAESAGVEGQGKATKANKFLMLKWFVSGLLALVVFGISVPFLPDTLWVQISATGAFLIAYTWLFWFVGLKHVEQTIDEVDFDRAMGK